MDHETKNETKKERAMATRHEKRRATERGAAMVEAIVVMPVLILVFVGMSYFHHLYKKQLLVMRLARVAAVAYGMSGCNGSPTENVAPDFVANGIDVGASGTSPGSTHVGSIGGAAPAVGSGNAVGSALDSKGMDKDAVASVRLSSAAAAGDPVYAAVLRSSITSTAYMSCGEVPMQGDVGDALKFVKGLFTL
jgi:hypothetical protein